ncbi:alpha/beta fold hydrolase [Pelomonas sp. KK5]|uniref:alpha/beta fold hydrolase n=1 Tax=Pelomonas sp. KK5 TaxID=1855730 RepID=UPI00097C5FB8|nr:alpha/beta hydrolase [Pelomonas sp. KK5]
MTEPVLILIHGATINGQMWAAVRRHLDPRWRVIAPDLPGHGSRRGERFTLEGAVQTVLEAARAAAPSPVILAGDSLGGYTVMNAASRLPPGQLKGVIASGCTADFSKFATWPHFFFKALMFRVLLALFGEQKLIASTTSKVRKELSDAGMQREDIDAMVDAGFSLKVFQDAVDALSPVDHIAKLAAVLAPVLLVNGLQDGVMMRHEAAYLAASRRGRAQHFDCGHGVSILKPREFAALLNEMAAGAAV